MTTTTSLSAPPASASSSTAAAADHSQSAEALYTSDAYLQRTGGTWHLEDAEFKAKYVDQLVTRNALEPTTVCEIGCGAGGVLKQLHDRWPVSVQFTGYEISPDAHRLSQQFRTPRLRFSLEDAFAGNEPYDLLLALDVVEHVEDCYAFLRQCRQRARYKVYHIPLEITCLTAARDCLAAGFQLGHIHHFSWSSAMSALELTGHRVIDWLWTPVGLERGKHFRTRLANCARRLLPTRTAARVLGGYSLLALTE